MISRFEKRGGGELCFFFLKNMLLSNFKEKMEMKDVEIQ